MSEVMMQIVCQLSAWVPIIGAVYFSIIFAFANSWLYLLLALWEFLWEIHPLFIPFHSFMKMRPAIQIRCKSSNTKFFYVFS